VRLTGIKKDKGDKDLVLNFRNQTITSSSSFFFPLSSPLSTALFLNLLPPFSRVRLLLKER